VKKLISIGVALALLTMAVLPIGVAAYTEPVTFAKVPFAILQSGIELLGDLLTTLAPELGLPTWIAPILDPVAAWTGGPLSWTVDMLGWGVGLVGTVLDSLASTLGLPTWLAPLVNTIACSLFTPFGNVTAPAFSPC
jgi:tetrahydromethanopterin S-methyltransferase subunit C